MCTILRIYNCQNYFILIYDNYHDNNYIIELFKIIFSIYLISFF